MEENNNFSKMAEEKLNQKMEANKENRDAILAAMNEKFKEKVRLPPVVTVCTASTLLFDVYFISFELGQEVGRGAEEQGNQRARLRRRHLGRLKTTNGGLYRVFYVSKDLFFVQPVLFSLPTFWNKSSTLWIFQFSCCKCTCACSPCSVPPPLSLCSSSVQLEPSLGKD